MNYITKYDLIIFDLDGTIIDSKETIYLATVEAFVLYGSPVSIPKERFNGMIGKHFVDIFSELNLHVEDFEEFLSIYKSLYFKYIGSSIVYPGVFEIMEYLKQKGVKVALITTKSHDQTIKIMDYFNLSKYFDNISGRINGMPIKPEAEPLLQICNELGVPPKKSIIVGDTELDIRCGKNALAATCAVTYGYRDISFLKNENPDFIIDDFFAIKNIIQ